MLPCVTYLIVARSGVSVHVISTKVVWCKECISVVATHGITFLRTKLSAWRQSPVFRYATPEDEAQYWKASAEAQKRLNASNANITPADVPLVRYYVPKPLPRYRDRVEWTQGQDLNDYRISPKVFCKWHRMVFRGPVSFGILAGCRSVLTRERCSFIPRCEKQRS